MGDLEDEDYYQQNEFIDQEDFDPLILQQQNSIQGEEILEIKDVMKVINKEVQELSEILYFNEDNTLELLMQYNWNKEDIIQQYYSNSEKLLAEFKIKGIINNHENIKYNELIDSCSVCLCQEQLIKLGCLHRFCESCIKQTITQRVQKDKFLVVRCLWNGCNYKLPFSMIRRFSNPIEFEDLLCKKFVECSRYMAYCPAVNCNKILKPKFTSVKEVTCICQKKFCFYCKEELHPPCPCDLVKKWFQEMKKDEANIKWIIVNTKQCPFCKKQVERSFGCNFMMCKPPGGCGKAFCYVCSQPWEPDHKDHFKCNKYVPPNKIIEKEKELLQRYNFYYERFQSSQAAKEKAEQSLKKIQDEYIDELFIYYDFNKYDTQFLEEVVKELIQSRIVLKWSYCIAYYISKINQKSAKLFDHYQELFEYACESLAISLIKLFDQIEILNVQQQDISINDQKRQFIKNKETIQNTSQKCQRMRQNLESAIYQGDINM
ncbi:unnamed protein product [Paramecium pentaurelia]|uniref:RBR-type E3 ubiquitin transferase n=1 Tax=Paramecium pentaurelia TaxID=43138 RepID=A0A8S1XYE5_9CILI|nr:unnamed protein product [Paramecium pentaurelia]